MIAPSATEALDVAAPLVVHLMYRFECGGMQTIVAESINRMPAQRYRHAIVCLYGFTDYADSIRRADVTLHDLARQPGHGLSTHLKLWSLLRRLKPTIVHTYNIGALEYTLTALLAAVPIRIHAEHGRGMVEIGGRHSKYNLLRRLLSPVVDTYVAVSADLDGWLKKRIGIPARKVRLIPNGVDTGRHLPAHESDLPSRRSVIWIGTVGRVDHIKNQVRLLDAFKLLLPVSRTAFRPTPGHRRRRTAAGRAARPGGQRKLDGPRLASGSPYRYRRHHAKL